MIDIKHLVEHTDLYTIELTKRFMDITLADTTKKAHENWKKAQFEFEKMRTEQNTFNAKVVKLSGDEKQIAISEMKKLSEQVKAKESQVRELKEQLDTFVYKIPNLTWANIPVGKDDESNVETKVYESKPAFDFEPKNYYELPIFIRDYLGEKGVEAAGSRGYYIKGELAKLQRVLFNWVLDNLIAQGFDYVIAPIMVNEKVMYGTGFFPTGKSDFYTVNPDEDNLFLVGSSEPSLMFMESDQILNLETPRKLTAWTTCFRRESGTYGKDTKGGIRVHQFEKVETVIICKAEESDQVFEQMTAIFQQRIKELGLHFHDLEVSTGDISIKNKRQIDIEAWFPAQNTFREICSSSHCTDYQTRNLNIRYKNEQGETKLAHSLNCTGITNRTLFAILEQFQQADGSIKLPKVLAERYGKEIIN